MASRTVIESSGRSVNRTRTNADPMNPRPPVTTQCRFSMTGRRVRPAAATLPWERKLRTAGAVLRIRMALQSVPEITDEQLVRAVLDGDRDAFGHVVERYKRGIGSF